MSARPTARPIHALAALTAILAAAAACRDVAFEPQDPRTVTYAPTLGIDLSRFKQTSDGVYYQDAVAGSGAVVRDSSTINVLFHGYLANGFQFDSAVSTAISYDIRNTIPGWRSGLKGAQQGGRRLLVIPPSLAYGNTSRPRIPAGSVLYFVIDLAGVTNPTTTTTSSVAPTAPAVAARADARNVSPQRATF